MLTFNEKEKVKDVLSEGLNINRNINFPYFLDCIDRTNARVMSIEGKLNEVLHNQRNLERKIDMLMNLISRR